MEVDADRVAHAENHDASPHQRGGKDFDGASNRISFTAEAWKHERCHCGTPTPGSWLNNDLQPLAAEMV